MKMLAQLGGAVCIALVLIVILNWQQRGLSANLGVDVSWPNCTVVPPGDAWGIVGVSGGLDFHQNKCVRNEASWFPKVALYMNTGWPGTNYPLQFPDAPLQCALSDNLCLAYNYGFHAAEYAINFANAQLVHSSTWWLDVETENSWTTNLLQNRAALAGMVAALQQNVFGVRVGFYSYPGQWTQIVGAWKPGLPAWVATGTSSKAAALLTCHEPSFTGGPTQLSQYTLALDEDYLCTASL